MKSIITSTPEQYTYREWTDWTNNTPMGVLKRIAELEAQNRDMQNRVDHYLDFAKQMEKKVERLTTALLETPCSCIGLHPCRKEGTKCSRCVALESE